MVYQSKGAFYGLVAVISATISASITASMYILFNPSFNIENSPMSTLCTGPYGSGFIFSIGTIISGLSLIPFYYSLSDVFNKRRNTLIITKTITRIALISCIGLVLTGIFPFDESNIYFYLFHGFVSTIYFMCTSVVYFLYWLVELKVFKFFNYLSILSLFTSLLYSSFWITGTIQEYNILDIPSLTFTVQWYCFIGSMVWIYLHALFVYHEET